MKINTGTDHSQPLRLAQRGGALLAAIVVSLLGIESASAVTRDQAKRIHDRLTGTPPSAALLTQLQAMDAVSAARFSIDPTNAESKGFYNVTLKNFATPWTNRDQTVFAPLNDYTATVIGMVRDDVPFNTLLSADLLYVGVVSGAAAYSNSNNNNYQFLEDNDSDLRLSSNLAQRSQSSVTGIPAQAVAGVITSRAAAEAFFIDGTNRAMFRFTLLNHLCHDLEQVEETSRPPNRIRQDVSRSPGGDSRGFLNGCIGCHAGMDPMAQAFAYYDFAYPSVDAKDAGQLVYTGPGSSSTQVQAKYTINSDNFKPGYVTPDNHWDNYWRQGPNKALGWSNSLPGSGTSAATLGQELGNSQAFAQCQVEKVFKAVCFRAPGNSSDRSAVSNIVAAFKSSSYSMREVFAQTAAYCAGD